MPQQHKIYTFDRIAEHWNLIFVGSNLDIDYTAICMLEEFKKESSIQTTDRILRDIGKKQADEIMETKTPRLPSETFIRGKVSAYQLPSSIVALQCGRGLT
jgi:hypothetical protein